MELLARLAEHVPARQADFISGIFDSLAPAGLLDTQNLAQLTEVLRADPGRLESLYRELAELAIPHQIGCPDGRVFELPLLTQRSFEDRLHGGSDPSYTCQARVHGSGVEDGKVAVKQQRWATWCRAAEARVEQQWRAGVPLTEIIGEVAAIRRHIAHAINETTNADQFGKFKTSADRHNATDLYSSDSMTIVDRKLWPALKMLAEECRRQFAFERGDELQTHHEQLKGYISGFEEHHSRSFETKYGGFVARHTFHMFRELEDFGEVAVHEFPGLRDQKEEQAFHEGFARAVGSTEERLRKLEPGDHGLDREAIQLLGGFAYDMTALYPFRRGGGAIMQICIRGVLRACGLPCPTQLNDMRLSVWGQSGEYHVPLDVAAQFMPASRDKYVELFTGSVLRAIRAHSAVALPARNPRTGGDSNVTTLTLNIDLV
ncbi:hypothetical protein [Variovorax sp. WDL1]|uniref:hypothetical protein n=1 Tax=Variovorax sp. WDL1 TaxID=207745 RepID=UPI001E53450C|nr:hypothetical protein [Variovorax sp. WDL1]